MNNSIKIIASAAVALLSANVAQAADAQTQAMVVKYSDLNLQTEAGQAKLEQRVRQAANRVCNIDESERSLRARSAAEACRAKAIADALGRHSKDQLAIAATFVQPR